VEVKKGVERVREKVANQMVHLRLPLVAPLVSKQKKQKHSLLYDSILLSIHLYCFFLNMVLTNSRQRKQRQPLMEVMMQKQHQ
jgi:hypothetical protein